jgi:hypothetical protein
MIAASGSIEAYISAANRVPMLTEAEEQRLARQFRDADDLDAARQLVTSHLRWFCSGIFVSRAADSLHDLGSIDHSHCLLGRDELVSGARAARWPLSERGRFVSRLPRGRCA